MVFPLLLALLGFLTPAPSGPVVPAGTSPTVAALGFASAIALQGDRLFVGHSGIPVGWQFNPSRPGAVRVFQRGVTGTWAETSVITEEELEVGDGYGTALAVAGDLLAVGAPPKGSGTVYLYAWSADRWERVARLALPGGAEGDLFGHSLLLRGDRLLVGAPGAEEGAGQVREFRRSVTGTWADAGIVATGTGRGVRLGASLAMAGDRLVVGAPATGSESGVTPYVLVLGRGDAGWREEARIAPSAPSEGFGHALLLDDTRLLIASPGADRGVGAVHVYANIGGQWSLVDRLQPAAPTGPEEFGRAVAIDGDELLIGAPLADGRIGAVHRFTRGPGGWIPREALRPERRDQTIMFGHAVAAAAGRLAIGGPIADFWEGTGWLYARTTDGAWRAEGTVTPGVSAGPRAITAEERHCEGEAVEGFPCAEVDLLSFLPVSAIGGKRGVMLNDIWGWTDSTTNREYAIVGRVDGTSFVDVTDPSNPLYLGDLPMHDGARPNRWRDMKTYKDHVFIVADNGGRHGMQVFDLTRLRNVVGAPVTFTEDAHYDRFAESHNIAINEETGFAYTVGNGGGGESCGGGLHMIDIREPTRPTFAGCFADPAVGRAGTGGVHDTQCVIYRGPDTRYQGRELCFNSAETALAIVDVTDKQAPRTVAIAAYPSTAYAHQGWLTEDQKYFFMGDEGDEANGSVERTRTLGWDVADLEDPVLLTEFLGTTGAIDHNLYIRGRYMYQSNYASGLRVIDIADPAHPRETGYFDSVPTDDNGPGFAGSWSNYPYFPSGTIIFTSRKEGLFVVRHRPRTLVP